ncbi:MAG: hypothetical protein ACM359_11765 [Bacillota bacterium]
MEVIHRQEVDNATIPSETGSAADDCGYRTPVRARFQAWVRDHYKGAIGRTVPELVQLFGGRLSKSAAYRIARSEGLKGLRSNRTRYARFWALVNWELPDTDLARVWRVDRGNLRARRARLGIEPSRWRLPSAYANPRYRRMLGREMRRAAMYRGPRPA